MTTKKKEDGKNIKLGVMVVSSAIALVAGLYLVGDYKHMFGHTFTLQANFKNVNGLTEGNHVRFSGIDVGTVKTIDIVGDTTVLVTMAIEEKVQPYIRKNAVAEIGTEGMMGNKTVNIEPAEFPGLPVADNDVLKTVEPVDMEKSARTLAETNKNVKEITENLKTMAIKLDSSALWSVLSDTTVAENLKSGVHNFNDNMKGMKHSFLLRPLIGKKNDK